MALEAEVAGLDDAGVHGPDGDLVHLVAFDLEVRSHRGPAAVYRARTGLSQDALGHETVLLPQLALEEVRLRAVAA